MARLRPYLPLLLLAVIALVLRIGVIYLLDPVCDPSGDKQANAGLTGECFQLFGDTEYVAIQAQQLADGRGFLDSSALSFKGEIRPGAAHPPVFTIFLATLDKLGLDSVGWWRGATALTGAIGVLFVGLAGWRLGGSREHSTGERSRAMGIIAGTIATLNPWLWSRDAELLVESLVIPLIGLLVLAALRLWRRPNWPNTALVGLVVGTMWLTRAELVLVLACMIPLFWGLRSESWPKRVGMLALTGAIAAAMMAPWVLYNMGRFEHRVYISTNLGMAELLGACDATYYGKDLGYWTWECVDPVDTTGVNDDSESERLLSGAAHTYIGDHKARTPVTALARVGRFWGVYAPVDTVRRWAGQEGMGTLVARTGWLTLVVMTPLAVLGGWHLRRRRTPISPLIAPIVVATFAALVLIPIPRFRVGADVTMVLLASAGIDVLWQMYQRRRGHT